MPARSVCLVTLSLSEAGPGRFGRQVSVTDIYHAIPYIALHFDCYVKPNQTKKKNRTETSLACIHGAEDLPKKRDTNYAL